MELQGLDENGKIVKARIDEFAKENAQEGEVFAGVGSTPAHIRYRKGKEFREVDSRELATQAGIKQVQFNFNPKLAEEMNLIQSDVDSSVAYNLERIRSDDGKREYLANKGRQGIFNEGDDYYAVENGYIKRLNNEDGLDWSDVARIGAKAGRDFGAAAGALLTGAGAAATGGAALAAVGVASAGGAVLGEMAQRGADKLFGADAAKYNAKQSGAEEVAGAATDLGMGALQGVGGQFVAKGLGFAGMKAAQGVAQLTEKLGTEKAAAWTANYAARKESGYLASQLPGKWLQSAGSAEEAKAMAILKDSSRPEKTLEAIKRGNQEARDLVSGKSKQAVEPSATQDGLDQDQLSMMFKQKAAMVEQQKLEKKAAEDFSAATVKQREAEFNQGKIQTAKDVFKGSYGDEVDSLFSPNTLQNEAEKKACEIESAFISNLSKNTKVKIKTDANGRALDVDDESLVKYTTNKINSEIEAVADNIDHNALIGIKFAKVPTDIEKSRLASSINTALDGVSKSAGAIGDKEASLILGSLNRIKHTVDNHTAITADDAAFGVRQFLKEVRAITNLPNIPPSVHQAFATINDEALTYTFNNSEKPAAVTMIKSAQKKIVDMQTLVKNGIQGQDGGVEFLIKHFNDLSRVGGDPSGNVASEVAGLWHLKLKLSGGDSKKAFSLMNDKDRLQYQAIDTIRNHATLVPKRAEATAPAEEGLLSKLGRHGIAASAAGVATTVATSLAGGAGLLIAQPVYQGVLKATTKEGMKTAAKGVSKGVAATAKTLSKPMGNKRIQGIIGAKAMREATGAEEFVANQLQNFTKSGHNKKD